MDRRRTLPQADPEADAPDAVRPGTSLPRHQDSGASPAPQGCRLAGSSRAPPGSAAPSGSRPTTRSSRKPLPSDCCCGPREGFERPCRKGSACARSRGSARMRDSRHGRSQSFRTSLRSLARGCHDSFTPVTLRAPFRLVNRIQGGGIDTGYRLGFVGGKPCRSVNTGSPRRKPRGSGACRRQAEACPTTERGDRLKPVLQRNEVTG